MESLKKRIEEEFHTKVDIQFHSQSLFPLYLGKFEKPVKIHNREFSQIAIKEIEIKDMAFTEFEGLQLLMNFKSRIPYPLSIIENKKIYLIMEFIDKTAITKEGKRDLIYSLKNLYSHRYLRYGFDKNNFIGTLVQKNQEYNTFFEFWWYSRIKPMMENVIQKKYFSLEDKEKLKEIIYKLCNKWNFDQDLPRPVHGDLWSGNILFSGKFAYLIDPSFGYSHPVQDFAMLELFGSPLNFSDYIEIANYCNFSLHPEMIEFFQMYPLLVHVIMFGISYQYPIKNFINKF